MIPPQAVAIRDVHPQEREFCRNEVTVMQRMAHPNIVGYIDSVTYKDRFCIMMEYCDGGDLSSRLDQAKVRGTSLAQARPNLFRTLLTRQR